jgi:hypothetical protein
MYTDAMSVSRSSSVVIVSLQVQTSFQSVPLGAASVVSALRSDRCVTDAPTFFSLTGSS